MNKEPWDRVVSKNNKSALNKYSYIEYSPEPDVLRKAGGIIFNKSLTKVVMVLNKCSFLKGEHKWGLPKGHLELYEKINKGAMREIKEETGLDIKILPEHRCIKINNSYYYLIVLNTDNECELAPIDTNEIIYSKWIELANIGQINKNYDTRSVFKTSKLLKIRNIIKTHRQKLTITI